MVYKDKEKIGLCYVKFSTFRTLKTFTPLRLKSTLIL